MIPGSNSVDTWWSLFHVAYITTHQLLGGFYGAEFLLPVARVDLNTSSGRRTHRRGLGDLAVSPLIIEWPGTTFFGKPYFSRVVAFAVSPTGSTTLWPGRRFIPARRATIRALTGPTVTLTVRSAELRAPIGSRRCSATTGQ